MISVIFECKGLMDEYWQHFHHNRETFYGIDRRHEATIRFLMDLSEYAIIHMRGRTLHEKATIIDFASGTTNWVTMHDLVDLIHWDTHLPEDVNLYISETVVDWAVPKNPRIEKLIAIWHAALLVKLPLEHPELLERNQPFIRRPSAE